MKQNISVANEIEQICKETELSTLRLKYVKLLISSCLDSKIRFGSALWNILENKKITKDLNKIKPSLLKRVMEIPQSTPSVAIQYEFGINNLELDILSEKVILAIELKGRTYC